MKDSEKTPIASAASATPAPQVASAGIRWGRSESRLLPPGLIYHLRAFAVLSVLQGYFEIANGLSRLTHIVFNAPTVAAAYDYGDGMVGVLMAIMEPQHLLVEVIVFLPFFAGVIRIPAGYLNYRFQGYGFAFVALGGGVLNTPFTYTFPTAVALGVYGIVVLSNPQVVLGFKMRKQGLTCDEILARFSSIRRWSSVPEHVSWRPSDDHE